MSISERIIIENANGIIETELKSLSAGEGIITISEPIKSEMSVEFALLLKHFAKEEKDITILIDSPGGEVNAGLIMYDLIQSYPFNIDMYCVGHAASMAALLLAGGRKGHRFILPHAHVMIHEPLISNGFGGSATTIERTAQSILEIKASLNSILAKHTGKTHEEIDTATLFDNFMTADESVEFGICDAVKSIY